MTINSLTTTTANGQDRKANIDTLLKQLRNEMVSLKILFEIFAFIFSRYTFFLKYIQYTF